MELNREQVVKALECFVRCTNSGLCDDSCPQLRNAYCRLYILKDALDLIRELTEENERLEKEVDRLSQVVLYHDSIAEMMVEEAKADTVRKMLQRIKEDVVAVSLLSYPPKFMLEIREDALDQIAKEMLEEET